MSDTQVFKVVVPMPSEDATATIDANANFIGLYFDTPTCLGVSLLFRKISVDEVRSIAHALLGAADAISPPVKN